MKLSRILLLASLLVLLGCGAGGKHLDARTRALLASADRVEVYRLDGKDGPFDRESGTPAEGERIGGYRVTTRGKDQGREFAARLAALLDDEKTYTNESAKCFWPGVAFRVTKGEGAAVVLICFRCKNLYAGPPTDRARENGSFHGSPNTPQLIGLAQEAFPDDKEIQGLSPGE